MDYVLRPYQEEALHLMRMNIKQGILEQIWVSPPGSGKTVGAAAMIKKHVARGGVAYFLAHRTELIDQCGEKLSESGVRHGILQGDRTYGLNEKVVVTSTATLHARYSDKALIKKHGKVDPALRMRPTMLVTDECHRSASPTLLDIYSWFPQAIKIGLTGTPARLDGKPLGKVYKRIVETITVQGCLDMDPPSLVPPTYITPPTPEVLRAMRAAAGHSSREYDKDEVAKALDDKNLIGNIVSEYIRHAAGRRAFCYASSVEHSKHIAQSFLNVGIPALHVDGNTPDFARRAAMQSFKDGRTLILSSYGVYVEGVDVPAASCAILARLSRSLVEYRQMIGRPMRPHPPSNKTDCIILDHAGMVQEHGLATDEIEWSLTGRPKKKGVSRTSSMKTCPICYALLPSYAKKCPATFCNYVWPAVVTPPPKEVNVPLVELKTHTLEIVERRAGQPELHIDGKYLGDCPDPVPPPQRITFTMQGSEASYKGKAYVIRKAADYLQLVSMHSDSLQKKRAQYEFWLRLGAKKGYKPGWAGHIYRARYNEDPPREWLMERSG